MRHVGQGTCVLAPPLVLVLAVTLALGALRGVVGLGEPEFDRLDDVLVHVLGGDDPGYLSLVCPHDVWLKVGVLTLYLSMSSSSESLWA